MKEEITNILAENSEALLDSLLENEILQGIPVFGTSLSLFKIYQNVRDTAYLNKVKHFVNQVGDISENQKTKLIEESKKSEKSRAKFGDALLTTIEQSDSLIKIEYLAAVFEAFLNDEISQYDLRLCSHTIHVSFSSDLEDVIENDRPQQDLKYLVSSGLADTIYKESTFDMGTTQPDYELSNVANQLRGAWSKYGSSSERSS